MPVLLIAENGPDRGDHTGITDQVMPSHMSRQRLHLPHWQAQPGRRTGTEIGEERVRYDHKADNDCNGRAARRAHA